MRMRFTIYKNSQAATMLSFVGAFFAYLGLLLIIISVMTLVRIVNEDSVGILITAFLFFVLGIWMTLQAEKVSKRKMINQVIREIQERGLEQQIRYSYGAAVQLYNQVPDKLMLKYIRSLNPRFAWSIQMTLDSQKKKGTSSL